MPSVPLLSPSCPRLRATCYTANNNSNHAPVRASTAQAIIAARNAVPASPSSAAAAAAAFTAHQRNERALIQAGPFDIALARVTLSMRWLDDYLLNAFASVPSEALQLERIVHAYRRAAEMLRLAISPGMYANRTLRQLEAVQRLLGAGDDLSRELTYREQSLRSSSVHQRYLSTVTPKPSPLIAVTKMLEKFSGRLHDAYALLADRHYEENRSARSRRM